MSRRGRWRLAKLIAVAIIAYSGVVLEAAALVDEDGSDVAGFGEDDDDDWNPDDDKLSPEEMRSKMEEEDEDEDAMGEMVGAGVFNDKIN